MSSALTLPVNSEQPCCDRPAPDRTRATVCNGICEPIAYKCNWNGSGYEIPMVKCTMLALFSVTMRRRILGFARPVSMMLSTDLCHAASISTTY